MSSFKKRTTSKSINGTKTSLQNGQLIISTGNPSLDHLLGGGLPLGSLLLIEEDKFVTYSKVLGKYFLAEGIFSSQSIFLASLDDEPFDLIKKLPKPVESDQNSDRQQMPDSNAIEYDNDEMRIAWRYNVLPKVISEQSSSIIGHNFNLTEQIDEETLKSADITCWMACDDNIHSEKNNFSNIKYFELLNTLASLTKCDKFTVEEDISTEKSVLRICITSLGSPLWYEDNFQEDFLKFLTILKSIVRRSSAVCFLSIPFQLLNLLDHTLLPRIRNIVDYSFELESFAGSEKETNPVFKEYNGIFHIRKLAALNTLAAFNPDTTDLAFKLRRKKFVIEKLHLPPELQESTNEQPVNDIVPSLSCGSGTKNLLDF